MRVDELLAFKQIRLEVAYFCTASWKHHYGDVYSHGKP